LLRKLRSGWQITLLKGAPAKFLGYVEAPDEKAAIEAAGRNSRSPKRGGIGSMRYAMSDRAAPVVRREAEEDWAVSMKQTTRFDEECRRALARHYGSYR
jgi:hypothetical protein